MKKKRNALTPDRLQEVFSISRFLFSKIQDTPKEGYILFLDEWPKLTTQEKELIKNDFVSNLEYLLNEIPEINFNRDSFCRAIIAFINDDMADKQTPSKLTLGKNYKQNQVAKLFYDLKARGVITDTSEQIALVISNTFDFKFQTILHYLKNPDILENVPDLINTKI